MPLLTRRGWRRETGRGKQSCVLFAPPKGRRGISLPIRNLVKTVCVRLKEQVNFPHRDVRIRNNFPYDFHSHFPFRDQGRSRARSFLSRLFVNSMAKEQNWITSASLPRDQEEETSFSSSSSFSLLRLRQQKREIRKGKGKIDGYIRAEDRPSITGSRVVNTKLIEGNDVFRAEPLSSCYGEKTAWVGWHFPPSSPH